MADLFTTIPTVLKWASKICSPLLRLFYSAAKLESYLVFDISSTGDPVLYQYHAQEGSCHLTVTNLSPFDYVVDRIKVSFVLDGGGAFTCSNEMPCLVKGASRGAIFMRSSSAMTQQVAQTAKEAKRAQVEITAHIITKIRAFPIHRYISDFKNFRFNA